MDRQGQKKESTWRASSSGFLTLFSVFPAAVVCGPDDIAREICRHCAAAELREGNTAVPLTSPCYNAARSLFVVRRSPTVTLPPFPP